jgi:hypothetical protein
VNPSDASIYIDGYLAGTVSEFDGRFQRLHVVPGEHEIVIHLPGYRSLRQNLYLGPNATRTIEGTLERRPAGEPDEPVPQPSPRARDDEFEEGEPAPQPGPARGAPVPPQRPAPQAAPEPAPPARTATASTSRFTVLSFTVEPDGATLLIDGQQHEGPRGNERVLVQVAEGHHVIEVQRRGYATHRREIDVKAGDTVPIAVVLERR